MSAYKALPFNPHAAPEPLISRLHIRYDTRYLTEAEIEAFEKSFFDSISKRTDLSPTFKCQLLRYDSATATDQEALEAGDTGIARWTISTSRDLLETSTKLWREYITPLRQLQKRGRERIESERQPTEGAEHA